MKITVCLIAAFSLFSLAKAQDTLPKTSVRLVGNKAIISWYNPYNQVTSITIQRSGDSIRNFKSIGSVLNPMTNPNGFLDPKEFLPNDQYYRLFITFQGGRYEFTDPLRPVVDTTARLGSIGDIIAESERKEQEEDVEKKEKRFRQSVHVYYALPDQNVVLSLPNAESRKYRIKFFEEDGSLLFELNKIPESKLILDKSSFNHSGMFRFELYDNNVLIENHQLYIP